MDLGSNKFDKNDDSSPKIVYLHNYLLMSIIDNPENDVSYSEVK